MPIAIRSVILLDMDYEYEGEEPYESRVLWGRVGVYAGSLLLVFILGSCVGGRGQASQSEVVELRSELAATVEEKTRLENELAAVSASGGADADADPPPRIGDPEGEDDPAETSDADADGGGTTEAGGDASVARTYEVQPGDTLTAIAARMYGDPQKFPLIAEANDLDGQLVVGEELVIPPDT